MIESKPKSSQRSNVLRDTLEEIEILRLARQEEVRDHPHPLLKRFTQQELTDEVCPTYKNLLVGRSQRIPSRQTLMQIADYLECTIAQRNDLLLAARYLPESLELKGLELQQALEQARQLMRTLPYPAMLVTHTLEIEALNEAFQRLFELPLLTALPRTQRHVLPLFFGMTCRSEGAQPLMSRPSQPGRLVYHGAFNSLSKATGYINLSRGIKNW